MLGEQPFTHSCSEIDNADLPVYFWTQVAVDQETKEEVNVIMLTIQTPYNAMAIQLKYCPWCGVLLDTRDHFQKNLPPEKVDTNYIIYRKLFVKSGVAGVPMNQEDWKSAWEELNETLTLRLYAVKEDVKQTLTKRIDKLREKLLMP